MWDHDINNYWGPSTPHTERMRGASESPSDLDADGLVGRDQVQLVEDDLSHQSHLQVETSGPRGTCYLLSRCTYINRRVVHYLSDILITTGWQVQLLSR